jgi:hypothetical protein
MRGRGAKAPRSRAPGRCSSQFRSARSAALSLRRARLTPHHVPREQCSQPVRICNAISAPPATEWEPAPRRRWTKRGCAAHGSELREDGDDRWRIVTDLTAQELISARVAPLGASAEAPCDTTLASLRLRFATAATKRVQTAELWRGSRSGYDARCPCGSTCASGPSLICHAKHPQTVFA